MLPDRVSNPGPLTYESGALPIRMLYNTDGKKFNMETEKFEQTLFAQTSLSPY